MRARDLARMMGAANNAEMNSRTISPSSVPTGAGLRLPDVERTPGSFARWAFYVFMFTLPFEMLVPAWLPEALKGSLSIPRVAGGFLLAAILLDGKIRPLRLPAALLAFFIFFLVNVVSQLRGDVADFKIVMMYFQSLILFIFAYNMFLASSVVTGALLSFVFAGVLSAVLTLNGVLVDTVQVAALGGRLSGFGHDPNGYAIGLMVGVLLAAGLAHFRKGKRKGIVQLAFLWGGALVMLLVIIRTLSRGVTLALVAGALVMVLGKGTFSVRLRSLLLVAVAGGVVFWFSPGSEDILERWSQTIETGDTSGREEIVRAAVKMLMAKPLMGWGSDAPGELIRLQGGVDLGDIGATHNNLLGMLIHHGLLGTLPAICGYVIVFRAAWRARTGVEDILPLTIFTAFFVTNLSLGGGYIPKFEWTFFSYQLAAGYRSGFDHCPLPAGGRRSLRALLRQGQRSRVTVRQETEP